MDKQKRAALGWFVGALAHSEDPQMSEPEPEDLEESVRLMQKAAERVFLPGRVKELEAAVAELEKEQRGRVSNKPKKSVSDPVDLVIATIKRKSPGISIEGICKKLDGAKDGALFPDRYRKLGFVSWHSVWTDKKYRNRVKRKISSIPPAKRKQPQ